MSDQNPLIFIDFDGVLHPIDQLDLFCREEHLARVLADFPGVEIVITSAWRKTHTLKTMREFFLTDLESRVVGVTPIFKPDEANTAITPGARYHEIQRYLAASGDPARRWIALDDDATWFPPGCAQVVLCDPRHGFTAATEKALRAALTALL